MFGKKKVSKMVLKMSDNEHEQLTKAMSEVDRLAYMTGLEWHLMTEKALHVYKMESFKQGMLIGAMATIIGLVAFYISKTKTEEEQGSR